MREIVTKYRKVRKKVKREKENSEKVIKKIHAVFHAFVLSHIHIQFSIFRLHS